MKFSKTSASYINKLDHVDSLSNIIEFISSQIQINLSFSVETSSGQN